MKIEDINKENIFKVPDGYFDSLPLKIQTKIQSAQEPVHIPIYRKSAFRYAVSLAAMLLLAIFLFWNYFLTPTPEKLLAQVPTEALISYLESSDISEDELLTDINSSVLSGDLFNENDLDMDIDQPDLSNEDIDRILNTLDSTNDYL